MSSAPTRLHRKLRHMDAGMRWLRAGTLATAGVVAAGVVLALAMLLDAMVHFDDTARWVGFFIILLILLFPLLSAARFLLVRSDEAAVARRLELATGRADNALINAVQLDRALPGESPWRASVLGELSQSMRGFRWNRALNWKTFQWCAAGVVLLALTAFAWNALQPEDFPQRLARILQPARDIAPITRTRIVDISPGNKSVPEGAALAIRATVRGEIPREAWLEIRTEKNPPERLLMTANADGTVWETQRTWNTSATYTIQAGDARSSPRRITVRLPAQPVAQKLTITPPLYTGLPTQTFDDTAPWPAIPVGSGVQLDWTFDRPLAQLNVTKPAVTTAENDTAPASQWTIRSARLREREWAARWNDTDGQPGARKIAFTLRADEAPKIHLREPGTDQPITLTREAWLKVSFEVNDDHGLATVAVCRSTTDQADATVLETFSPKTKTFTQSVNLPLAKLLKPDETEAMFCVKAVDNNTVTGPGVAFSRFIQVRIVSAAEQRKLGENATAQDEASLETLIELQRENLDATRAALRANDTAQNLATLVERQARIELLARDLLTRTNDTAAEWRATLESLSRKELPAAVIALRDASGVDSAQRPAALRQAETLQAAILQRLQTLPSALKNEATQRQVRDLISRVEALFQREKELHAATLAATAPQAKNLARSQDALADDAQRVRQALSDGAKNSGLGDAGFRAAAGRAAEEFSTRKIYENMLRAAEKLEGAVFPEAAALEKQVLVSLARVLEILNTWQTQRAFDGMDAQHKAAESIQQKLDTLLDRQRGVVEKSKELAAKHEFSAEDVATIREIAAVKSEMAQLLEQMLTDAHVFPDLRPMNELRDELTKIYEDVIQQDKELAQQGKLTPQEIPVQKEDGLLQAIEQAKETAEDMEMWLPNKNETQQWLSENFDRTEMPEIPNLPLADAFTDLVGDLLEEQEGLAEQVQDAASNQALAYNPANGWEVADGPMPGFNAQGRSGNTRPNKNEQTGRSSGGREGMSSGEMVNARADHLEGSKTEARRTNDPMQKGQVQDDGPAADAKATGGGKAGGASQREGMTGNAPLRPTQAPRQRVNDALAVEQALLAQQTARSYATARLLYLQTGPMQDVVQLMDESRAALQAGRIDEFQALHRRIVASLREIQTTPPAEKVHALENGPGRNITEKRLPGGVDTRVPEGFRDATDDYFRSLDQP